MGSEADFNPAGVDILQVAKNTLTDIIGTRFTPKSKQSCIRIGVVMSAVGKFGITIRSGVTTYGPFYFEKGATLVADAPYTWVWPVSKEYSYEFQHSAASGTLITLKVDEILSAEI